MDLNGPTRTRSNHDFKSRPRAARTNYFKFSFFNRYVNSHILLFLTVCGFFSFFVSYLSSSSSFFQFLHNVQLYTVLRHSLLMVNYLLVLSGGQFLYRNSVCPYCFPLPTVLLYKVFFG